MKTESVLLFCLCLILLLTACDFNAPLRNKMLDYYNKDDNYVQVTGVILKTEYLEEIDQLRIGIEMLTKDHSFSSVVEVEHVDFVIVHWSQYNFELETNDTVVFTSAPFYFYNGHIYPIVEIWKDGQEYLSFQEGKAAYIEWIENTFD